jgi:thiol-disulfide isomerase/thioredoxin
MAVQELNDSNYRSTLENAPLAFVDIYASWCGPCRLFAPLYDAIAAKHPKAQFFKIDGDLNPECRSDVVINNLPFVGFFRNGKFVDGVSTTTEEGFEEFVAKMGA